MLVRNYVDVNLKAASEMARLEDNLGLQSTFFLRRCSPCYNLIGRLSQSPVETTIAVDHSLGLHYGQGFSYLARTIVRRNQSIGKSTSKPFGIIIGVKDLRSPFFQLSTTRLQARV